MEMMIAVISILLSKRWKNVFKELHKLKISGLRHIKKPQANQVWTYISCKSSLNKVEVVVNTTKRLSAIN